MKPLKVLPQEIKDKIASYLTFHRLPDVLLLKIIANLAEGEILCDALYAVNQLRLLSKRFNLLLGIFPFVDELINYWSEKYKVAGADYSRNMGFL